MKLEDSIKITKDLPVIEIELLLAGVPNPVPETNRLETRNSI